MEMQTGSKPKGKWAKFVANYKKKYEKKNIKLPGTDKMGATFGVYGKIVFKITNWVLSWIWSFLAPFFFAIGGVGIILMVIDLLIYDAITKFQIKLYWEMGNQAKENWGVYGNIFGYYLKSLALILKGYIDSLAWVAKQAVTLALCGMNAIKPAISNVAVNFVSGTGAILSSKSNLLGNNLETGDMGKTAEEHRKKFVEITYTDSQNYEIKRREELERYERQAGMLQYSFRFGQYWEQALATGMVREYQLETYYNLKKGQADMPADASTNALLQSSENKAGEIKDVYYWRYIEALSEKERLEKEVRDRELNIANISKKTTDEINLEIEEKNIQKILLKDGIDGIKDKTKKKKYKNSNIKSIKAVEEEIEELETQKNKLRQEGEAFNIVQKYKKMIEGANNEVFNEAVSKSGGSNITKEQLVEVVSSIEGVELLLNEQIEKLEEQYNGSTYYDEEKEEVVVDEGLEKEGKKLEEEFNAKDSKVTIMLYNLLRKESGETLEDSDELPKDQKKFKKENNYEGFKRYIYIQSIKNTLEASKKDLEVIDSAINDIELKEYEIQSRKKQIEEINIQIDKVDESIRELEFTRDTGNISLTQDQNLKRLKEELKEAKEKLYRIYMEDNLLYAIEDDGQYSNENKVNYIMELYYEDERMYPELKESIPDLLDQQIQTIEDTFNRFVGGASGFEESSIDEALNSMVQKKYGGYGYPKSYYTKKTVDNENVIGAQLYTYEKTAIVAPENLKLIKIYMDYEPIENGKYVVCMDFLSEDGTREYRIVGIEEISQFFNAKAKLDYEALNKGKTFNEIKIGEDGMLREEYSDGGRVFKEKDYTYEHIIIPEGTVIGTFGGSIVPLSERRKAEKIQNSINQEQDNINVLSKLNESDVDENGLANKEKIESSRQKITMYKEELAKIKQGDVYDYIFVELNEDSTNSVLDVEPDFIIPVYEQGKYRFAVTEKEREDGLGSRIYGGAVTAQNSGSIEKIGYDQEGMKINLRYENGNEKVYTEEKDNLAAFGDVTKKLLSKLDPYWDSKYYIFDSNEFDIEKDEYMGTIPKDTSSNDIIGVYAISNYKILSVEFENDANREVVKSFILYDQSAKNTITYKVMASKDTRYGGQEIQELSDTLLYKLRHYDRYKIMKGELIGLSIDYGVSSDGTKIQRDSNKINYEGEGYCEILEAGRDKNGLLKIKVRTVPGNEVKEYIGLFALNDKVINKLSNMFNRYNDADVERYDVIGTTISNGAEKKVYSGSDYKINNVVKDDNDKITSFELLDLERDNQKITYKVTESKTEDYELLEIKSLSKSLEEKLKNYSESQLFNKNYIYSYAKWDEQYYDVKKELEGKRELREYLENSVVEVDENEDKVALSEAIAFKGRVIKNNGTDLYFDDLGEEIDVIAPENCIVTMAGWNNDTGYTLQLTSLDYERRYTFSELNGFSSWISGILGNKLGADWKETGKYEELDEYRIVNKGEKIGKMGASKGPKAGDVPMIAPETLRITKFGRVKENGVIKYCVDLESLDGERVYKITDMDIISQMANTSIKGDLRSSNKKVNLPYDQIEYNDCYMLSTEEVIEKGLYNKAYITDDIRPGSTLTNTSKNDGKGYGIRPLYIYEGEIIGYAKMKDVQNVGEKYATGNKGNKLQTKIEVGNNKFSGYDSYKQSSKLILRKKAQVNDLFDAFHVNVSIEQFGSLIPENFEEKMNSRIVKIKDVEETDIGFNLTYREGNHRVSKVVCYDNKGKVISTNELVYVEGNMRIEKIVCDKQDVNLLPAENYTRTKKKDEETDSNVIELTIPVIVPDNIDSVAKIAVYDSTGNRVSYDMTRVSNIEIHDGIVTVKAVAPQEVGIRKVEIYDEDNNLIMAKNVTYENKNQINFEFATDKTIAQIKIHRYDGSIYLWKPEVTCVNKVDENTIKLEFVKGANPLDKVLYYDSEGNTVEYIESDEISALDIETKDKTLENAKSKSSDNLYKESYESEIKIPKAYDIRRVEIYDKKGNFTQHDCITIRRVTIVNDKMINVEIVSDKNDKVEKIECYNESGKIISKQNDPVSNNESYNIEVDSNNVKKVRAYSKNGETTEYAIRSLITDVTKVSDNESKINLKIYGDEGTYKIKVYDNKDKKLTQSLDSQVLKNGSITVKKKMDDIKKVELILDDDVIDEYVLLKIVKASAIEGNQVKIDLNIDIDIGVGKFELYDISGKLIKTQNIAQKYAYKNNFVIEIPDDVFGLRVYDRNGVYDDDYIRPRISKLSAKRSEDGTALSFTVNEGINKVVGIEVYNSMYKRMFNEDISESKTSYKKTFKIPNNNIDKIILVDENGIRTNYRLFDIESVQKKGTNGVIVKLKGTDLIGLQSIKWSPAKLEKSQSFVWNTLQEGGKIVSGNRPENTIIPEEAGTYVAAIEAINKIGGSVLYDGPTIELAQRINTNDGSVVVNVVAKDKTGIAGIAYYNKEGERITELNQSLMNPEKELNNSTSEKLSKYASKVAKVMVFSESGLANVKDVDNKEIGNLKFEINSITTNDKYVSLNVNVPDAITIKKVKIYTNDGRIITRLSNDLNIKDITQTSKNDAIAISNKISNSTSKENDLLENKVIENVEYKTSDDTAVIKKIELIGNYISGKELVATYEKLRLVSITTTDDNQVIFSVNDLFEIGDVTYYYDDGEQGNNCFVRLNDGNVEIVIGKKNRLEKVIIKGRSGGVIEYNGPSITKAQKVDSDGGKFTLEAKLGVENDKITSINVYDYNDKIINLSQELIKKAKVSGDKLTLNVKIDDNIKEAKIVKVFTKNGMMAQKKIDDTTHYGNKIEIKDVTVLDSNKMAIEIKDSFYPTKINGVKIQKMDGTEEKIPFVSQGDKVAQIQIGANTNYNRIAVVDPDGLESNWYDLLQISSITPTSTGCMVNIGEAAFGLSKIQWQDIYGKFYEKEISGYGPISVNVEADSRNEITMISVTDKKGNKVEYQAATIKKAEKIEHKRLTPAQLNIDIEGVTVKEIDKIILLSGSGVVQKTYNSIDDLSLTYILDDSTIDCKKVKIVNKNGLSRTVVISQLEPKISSIEKQKDGSIKVVVDRAKENGLERIRYKNIGASGFGSIVLDKNGIGTIPKNDGIEYISAYESSDKIFEYGIVVKQAEKKKAEKKEVEESGILNKIRSIVSSLSKKNKTGELRITVRILDERLDDTFDKVEIYVDNKWKELESFDKNTMSVNNKMFELKGNDINATKVRVYTKKGFVAESNISG